ncbi:MAG: manno-octulosonate cytidylyltransferase [Sphingobium sp.]
MSTVIVIPARYASSRYPGKPLANIHGATGQAKSLIERSYASAMQVSGTDGVYVATDDVRIASAACAFGADIVMTPPECENGTERVAAAITQLEPVPDVIVNFQGDALLTPPDLVEKLIEYMIAHPHCPVATVAVRCSPGVYQHLITDQAAGRVGGTTVVLNDAGEALYFSKRVLPHIKPGDPVEANPPVLLHVGLYAYRAAALASYVAAPISQLEQLEGLEQLRFLAGGIPVAVVAVEAPDWDLIELNNPSDLPVIEAILAERGIA